MAEVKATITADASGVGPGAAEAAKQINSIQATVAGLSKSFADLAGAAKASMAAVATASKETATQVKEAAESVKAFREAFTGVGEAVMAAFAVEAVVEFAKHMAETAEQIAHTAMTFGLTTREVQSLRGMAAGAGTDVGVLTTGMMRLDRAFLNAKMGAKGPEEAFKAIGISTKESLTQTQLLQRTIEGFQGMEAGPAKVALAMQVFGRNIQAIGPLLGMEKEQMDEIKQSMADYGVVNDDAEAKGLALAESFNTNKIAMQGLGNVMAQSLAPVIKHVVDAVNDMIRAFVQSYNEGGAAKIAMDALAISLKVVVGIVELAAFQFAELMNAATWATAALRNLATLVGGDLKLAVQSVIEAFATLGRIMADVFTGNFAKAKQEQQNFQAYSRVVNGQMADNARAFGARMQGDNKATTDKMVADWKSYVARTKNLLTDAGSSAHLPKGSSATTGDDPGGNQPKAKNQPSQMDVWKESFLKEQDAHSDMLHNEEADEVAYWQRILATANVNAKQKVEIEKRIAELTRALNKEAINGEIADARQATADKIAEANSQLQATKKAIGDEARAAEDAYRRGEISRRQLHDTLVRLAQEEAAAEIATAAQVRDLRLALDNEIKARNAANTEAYRKAMADQAKAYQEFADKVRAANAAMNSGINKADQQSADEFKAKWDAAVNPMVHSFTSGLLEMARGTKSFAQVVGQMGLQMVNDFVAKVVEPMVARWIWGEFGKTVATTVGTQTRVGAEAAGSAQGLAIHGAATIAHIAMDAARAFAGAYAAIADIPYVGPFLAPAMAAGALAAVLAVGHQVFSAEGGWGDVPHDGATTVLHKREMVLPADIATPLRDGVRGGGGMFGKGDVHFHMGPGTDGNALQDWFDTHGDKLVKSVNAATRGGARLSVG